VGVRRYEVDGDAGLASVLEQVVDPAHGRGGWTADTERRIDGLDARRRRVVEVEIVGLAAGPEHLQGWLCPALEPPRRALAAAVALDEVSDERLDQLPPASKVARRRDDPAVVEHGSPWIRGEVVRHERQLDDRAQLRLEQAVQCSVDTAEVMASRA